MRRNPAHYADAVHHLAWLAEADCSDPKQAKHIRAAIRQVGKALSSAPPARP